MIHQTKFAKHVMMAAVAQTAGALVVTVMPFTFKEDYTAATDLIEMGSLPADHQLISAVVIGDGVGALTADVGLMDGTFGDPDDTRDLTADLMFDDENVNDVEAPATMADCLAIPVQSNNVGVGIKLSGDVAAGAKSITLVLTYAA